MSEKNLWKIVFSFFFILISSSLSAEEKDGGGLELQLVQVLYRHGDRNPIDLYPNDPYKNESFWPEGFSQLTKKGKQQQYTLGKYLRDRYDGYLSKSYSPYEIRVEASDVDRTLMSAEVDLAGLYPPNKDDAVSVWNKDLMWQPIPIHTVPCQLDNKLRMQAPCPRLQKLIDNFDSGPEMKAIYKENRELFEYLEKSAGKPVRTLQHLDYLYDALFIESNHNYTLPPWTHSVFPSDPVHNPIGKFHELAALSFKVTTWNLEMKRLKAGPLIKELVKHFQMRAEGSQNLDHRLKLFMYSAHDTTVAALLNALGIFNGVPPPYATAVIMELHKDLQTNRSFVKFLYRNDSTHAPYELSLPGCNSSCNIHDFISLTKPVVPDNWEAECQCGFMGLEGVPLAALIIGSFLSFILIVSVFAMALARRRDKKINNPSYPYLHLQMDDSEDA